jgi:hypothetical protein
VTDFDILKHLEYKKDLYENQGELIKAQAIEEVIKEIEQLMIDD